ncbi:hypothetical protein CLU79DRAFT_56101 [Phycomyces nitens]|nr:hypothetical protein CLU79DRAFT_56101 [Phycomyces nitens]
MKAACYLYMNPFDSTEPYLPYPRRQSNVRHTDRSCQPSSGDSVKQYAASLQARLGFAAFKMQHGWEKNTLPDVEGLWKKRRQQHLISLPTPKVTQYDIIERRSYPNLSNTKKKRRKQHLAARSRPTNTKPATNPQVCQLHFPKPHKENLLDSSQLQKQLLTTELYESNLDLNSSQPIESLGQTDLELMNQSLVMITQAIVAAVEELSPGFESLTDPQT